MQNEIDKLIAGQFNAADDAELNAELEDLMGNTEDSARAAVQAPVQSGEQLPEAPQHDVKILPIAPTGTFVVNSVVAAAGERKEREKVAIPS